MTFFSFYENCLQNSHEFQFNPRAYFGAHRWFYLTIMYSRNVLLVSRLFSSNTCSCLLTYEVSRFQCVVIGHL